VSLFSALITEVLSDMQTHPPAASDLKKEALTNFEFMRPAHREELSGWVRQPGTARKAVKSALLTYMKFWSKANWVDNSVSSVGFWIVADTPKEFSGSIRALAKKKKVSTKEGEKRAWTALLYGMDEAVDRDVNCHT
jgi:hypothetical protein